MDPSCYIKLIEFTYILEGFQILYEFETDKSTGGEMYNTASAIIDEIYQYSWFKRTLTGHSLTSLSQKWRKIINGEQKLDGYLFKNILHEINNVCKEYLLKKYAEQQYSSRGLGLSKVDYKQSIDSGIQSMVSTSMKSDISNQPAEKITAAKKEKTKVDKFANLPKELLERNCKTAANVLEKHINKTFSFLKSDNSQSGHSSKGSAESPGPLKCLNSVPSENDPILPILTYKLKNLSTQQPTD